MRKSTFIWRHGVRGFGIPVAALGTVGMYISENGWTAKPLLNPATLVGILVGTVVGALVGGSLWGLVLWWFFPALSERDEP